MSDRPRSFTNPGEIFAAVIFRLTGQMTLGCGTCATRKTLMNAWGWWGCWKHRREIEEWLIIEAIKRGHLAEPGEIGGLLRAAFKELRKRKA
jgi:hypothetical protein